MPGAIGRAAFLVVLTTAALTMAIAGPAHGAADVSDANYPTKPVRMIVPLAPGGGSDIVGRILAVALTEHWGQSVIVDNRPGAGSTVGTSIAARAPADGYTLLVTSSSIAISPALYKNLNFDIRRDFAGVTQIASQPSLLAVHSSVPVSSLKGLIALARDRPGVLAYASAGPGSATHLGTELFRNAAGINILHIPYKSAGQATAALLSGEAQILLTNMASVLPHVRSGRIRALGISSPKRSPLAPDLPTLSEAGIPGFEYATWYGMLVPSGTPKALVSRLHADTVSVLGIGGVRERFASQGLEVYGTAPAVFETYLNAELAKWARVVRSSDVRTD